MSPRASERRTVPYPVEPALGNWRLLFDDIVAAFATAPSTGLKQAQTALEDIAAGGYLRSERGAAALAFTLSLLIDIIDCGGAAIVRDSALWVYWPDWDGTDPSHREQMRRALARLKPAATRSFAPGIHADRAVTFLREMDLQVLEASTGATAETFRQGLTTWSMPYRGREGRARRLLAVGRARGEEYPLGIIEVGDEAPHSPARDYMCGFLHDAPGPDSARMRHQSGQTFGQWVAGRDHPAATLTALADRLAGIRSALRPVAGFETTASLSQLHGELSAIKSASAGRTGSRDDIDQRKRLAYLGRLVAGEAAMRAHQTDGGALGDGLRVLHDLTVPRIHLEATICGALPPFGAFLGGKLIASLFGHPLVRSLLDRQVGSITASLFDSRIDRFLPRHGAVLVTTKGLFAGHSAQYNRVVVPGREEDQRLIHVADTVGTTTSLLSDRTARLAESVLAHEGSDRAVSREYGSGGGKRQRTIEAAAIRIGLHEALVHARIRRPVYALPLVDNLPDVALLNEPPRWLIEPDEPALEFERRALAVWRTRWLPVAERRDTA